MSKERPTDKSELCDTREYWDSTGVVYEAWLLRTAWNELPSDLLLVPTREEWEATQRSANALPDAVMFMRRLIQRIIWDGANGNSELERQAKKWLRDHDYQGTPIRTDCVDVHDIHKQIKYD